MLAPGQAASRNISAPHHTPLVNLCYRYGFSGSPRVIRSLGTALSPCGHPGVQANWFPTVYDLWYFLSRAYKQPPSLTIYFYTSLTSYADIFRLQSISGAGRVIAGDRVRRDGSDVSGTLDYKTDGTECEVYRAR